MCVCEGCVCMCVYMKDVYVCVYESVCVKGMCVCVCECVKG